MKYKDRFYKDNQRVQKVHYSGRNSAFMGGKSESHNFHPVKKTDQSANH